MNEPAYRVEPIARGTRFTLPRRDLKAGRLIGLAAAGMGLFITGFMVLWMYGPISSGIGGWQSGGLGQNGFNLLSIGFGLLGLFGLIPGLGLLIGGLALASGRSRTIIEFDDMRICSIERVGPLRWTFRRTIDDIERVNVVDTVSGAHPNDDDDPDNAGYDDGETVAVDATHPMRRRRVGRHHGKRSPFGAILVHARRAKRPLVLAAGYPNDLVEQLALDLHERLGRDIPMTLPAAARSESEIASSSARDPDALVSLEPAGKPPRPQPTDSDAKVERRPGELTIEIPPAGLRRGSKGLFFFAIVWNAFITIFSAIWIPVWFSQSWPDKLVGLFVLPFIAIGIAMAVAVVNMGKRRTIIDVIGGALLISRKSIFGVKQYQHDRSEIESIDVGPSGMSVNDVPIRELQINLKAGGHTGILSERRDSELKWIASELRAALDVPRAG